MILSHPNISSGSCPWRSSDLFVERYPLYAAFLLTATGSVPNPGETA
jgi:hypothetical protein